MVDDDAYTTVCSLTLSTSVSEKLPSIEGVFSLAQSRHSDRGRLNFFVKVDEGQRVVTGCVSGLNSKKCTPSVYLTKVHLVLNTPSFAERNNLKRKFELLK